MTKRPYIYLSELASQFFPAHPSFFVKPKHATIGKYLQVRVDLGFDSLGGDGYVFPLVGEIGCP